MEEWQRTAKAYRKEIGELWKDIEDAIDELEKGMPKSYKKGLHMLEKALEFSMENVRILSYTEPLGSSSPVKQQPFLQKGQDVGKEQAENKERPEDEDRFKWLRN
jgi:hypothetical protein